MSESTYRGHTRIRRQALEHLAQAVTAETMNVTNSAVKASLHDRDSDLEISASTPVNSLTVGTCRTRPEANLYAHCAQARTQIAQRFTALSDLRVGGVVLTLTGIDSTEEEDERSVK